MSIFKKDIDPRCGYCQKGKQISNNEIGCIHRGVVKPHYHCNKFIYDPFKRIPPKPAKLGKNYSAQDFSLGEKE